MSKLNPPIGRTLQLDERLAGGLGAYAARQDAVSLLKRVVMTNLLWEDIAYIDGQSVAGRIAELVPQCSPKDVHDIALVARLDQKLRHTPLLLAVEMCRYPEHARLVGDLLPKIITRADMLTDFLALYWSLNRGSRSLSHQAAKGLARAFLNCFQDLHSSMLLPFDYLKAFKMSPEFKHLIEPAMIASARQQPKLKGRTLFIVDVSGSMWMRLSEKSNFTRLDSAIAMTILATEVCDDFEIVCTAGDDNPYIGAHEWIQYPRRGFDLITQIQDTNTRIGYVGIFTRQCLEWCKTKFSQQKPFDRIIVFSDSQDCDRDKRLPKPFAPKNYICDISCERHGVAYKGVWTVEISGFSEHFLSYIARLEQS